MSSFSALVRPFYRPFSYRASRPTLGEKVVPIPQESLILSSPIVNGAVMFGRAKDQCGILVEPAPSHTIDPSDPVALPKFRNMIW